MSVSVLETRGHMTINDAVIQRVASKSRDPNIQALLGDLTKNQVDAAHAETIIDALVRYLPSADAASIAAGLSRFVAFQGYDLAALVTMAQGTIDTQRCGGLVSIPGRLRMLDELVANLRGRLRWNELRKQIEFDGQLWTDDHTAALRRTAEAVKVSKPDQPLPKEQIEEAVRLGARNDRYHPVQDYLCSVRWDRVPRLGRLLADYLQCDDTPLNEALSRNLGIGAVRRVFEPGCKLDTMLIIGGHQGVRKSSAIKTLFDVAPGAYCEARINVEHRADAYLAMHRCWVWEIGELHNLDRGDQNMIKQMLSAATDEFLPPYGHHRVAWPRSSLMVGTTNHEHCLHDPTGNRRNPVAWSRATVEHPIDTVAIERDRDQLWAEAVYRAFVQPEPWHLSPELERAREEVNAEHAVRDESLEQTISEWLARPPQARGVQGDSFTVRDVLCNVLRIPIERHADRSMQVKVGRVLTNLGIKKAGRPRDGGPKITRYLFPTAQA